jgi:hypothetical protein
MVGSIKNPIQIGALDHFYQCDFLIVLRGPNREKRGSTLGDLRWERPNNFAVSWRGPYSWTRWSVNSKLFYPLDEQCQLSCIEVVRLLV